jgi:excisionase family DNA binding protein
MTTENMTTFDANEDLTFEKVPCAIAYLIKEMHELKQAVLQCQDEAPKDTDGWMNLEELKEYLPDHPANATVYGWVHQRKIPHHKGGKKLRFRKSEIDGWLASGKLQSIDEMEAAAQAYLSKNKREVL